MSRNDHLFISYASEDYELAQWLTLKLTAEGYKVWCDRIKLLGGESYPRDIDKAIKVRTFRLLALLSHSSISKLNPVKERTLALNIGRERGIDFLIPLNVDGLSSTELDWMTSDLTFVPFHQSWANGFEHLLKKLASIDAPRARLDGHEAVCRWFSGNESMVQRPERIWTNLVEIIEIPSRLVRISRNTAGEGWPDDWPLYRKDSCVVWAFEYPPDTPTLSDVQVQEVDWRDRPFDQGVRLADVVTNLIKQYLVQYSMRKGMARSADGRDLYFPAGLLAKDRLSYQGYAGTRTWVRVVGERSFRQQGGIREKTSYHLAPVFRPMLGAFDRPVVQMQLRVHLTDLQGSPLELRKALRRRKAICKHWWNHEWLSRLIGVVYWLANAEPTLSLANTASGRLALAGLPIRLTSPFGIDERALAPLSVDEQAEIVEDEIENRRDDEPPG